MDDRRDEIGTLSRSIRRMTIALQDRVNAVEAFAADVAHEVKNPLTSLQSAIETLNTSKSEEEKKELILIAFKDLKKKNHRVKLSEVKKSIKLRNLRDKNRKHSPLLKHRDALEIHTGKLNKKRMIDKMTKHIEKVMKI